MSVASYNQFQKVIVQDSALQEQFKTAAATSPESLGELVVKLGAERGYSFTLEDIQAAAEATSSLSAEQELADQELEMISGGIIPVLLTAATAAARAGGAIASQEAAESEEGEQTVEEAAISVSGS